MKKTLLLLIGIALTFTGKAQTIEGNRYRGFIDATFLTGNDGVYGGLNAIGGGIATSHGYQLNPNIFLGAGVGFHAYSLDHIDGSYAVPFFANFRVNMNSKKISPFFDAKIGYSVGDFQGFYASPSFGVRFGLKKNLGLNASVGYTAQGFDYIESYRLFSTMEKSYIHNLTLSLGLDF